MNYPKWADGKIKVFNNHRWSCPACGQQMQAHMKHDRIQCWCPSSPMMVRREDLEVDQ